MSAPSQAIPPLSHQILLGSLLQKLQRLFQLSSVYMGSHGAVNKYMHMLSRFLSNLATQSPRELASAPSLTRYRHTLKYGTVVREVVNEH